LFWSSSNNYCNTGNRFATDYSYVWTVPSGAFDPGNVATFNTTVGGTYSVVITSVANLCPSASASGVLTINPLPTASISSSGTVCSGTSAAVLFTGTPNTTVVYTINGGSNASINIGASGTDDFKYSVKCYFNLQFG
jgi:hypothetical protein